MLIGWPLFFIENMGVEHIAHLVCQEIIERISLEGEHVWAMSPLKTLSDAAIHPFQLLPRDVAFIA
jgi:hypothetical protein